MVRERNERWAIAGKVEIEEARPNFPTVSLLHPIGGTVTVYLQGATVTSWKPTNGAEVLFLSNQAKFEEGRAIRGGIPVIFPQFSADGPLPAHGVVRQRPWEIERTEVTDDGSVSVLFRLSSSVDTKNIWPYDFTLYYRVQLASTLTTTLEVRNSGNARFEYQTALHSYFSVGDIAKVRIDGIHDLRYRDNLADGAMKENFPVLAPITGEVDVVFKDAPSTIKIFDPAAQRAIVIRKQGFADAVLWNPWVEKSKSLTDLGDDEYRAFVCIEVGSILTRMQLDPGESAIARQELAVEPTT